MSGLTSFLSRATVRTLLQNSNASAESVVAVAGRVAHARRQKQWTFIEVNDGSAADNLHIVLPTSKSPQK
jgi:aspartyl/asparaginyl-tRNA synthetase